MAKILFVIFIVIVAITLISFINHKIHSAKEKSLLVPLGNMLEVNGHKMSIYTTGEGDKTLVFMSGGGTCSPILDFKSLYSLLSDDYKIVVVEKFGYGFSDVIDEERPIDSILEDTREGLRKAGIEGPFVLCPHSMSGIEALYWAQKYPDEVEAIVGLDMAVPEAYENYHIKMFTIRLGQVATRLGITRLLPGVSESDAIKYGTLTEEEKEIYRAVFYNRTATSTMIKEVQEIKDNAKIVDEGAAPICPMLLFISNGQGTGWDTETWRKVQINYISNIENAKYIELDCSHYVHDYKYKEINEEIRNFVN
ncbi:MAG: alpha/beta hydrolase [Clostridium sp.]|nr:alpha/beta hydrolase [Clostridium sp.]